MFYGKNDPPLRSESGTEMTSVVYAVSGEVRILKYVDVRTCMWYVYLRVHVRI